MPNIEMSVVTCCLFDCTIVYAIIIACPLQPDHFYHCFQPALHCFMVVCAPSTSLQSKCNVQFFSYCHCHCFPFPFSHYSTATFDLCNFKCLVQHSDCSCLKLYWDHLTVIYRMPSSRQGNWQKSCLLLVLRQSLIYKKTVL